MERDGRGGRGGRGGQGEEGQMNPKEAGYHFSWESNHNNDRERGGAGPSKNSPEDDYMIRPYTSPEGMIRPYSSPDLGLTVPGASTNGTHLAVPGAKVPRKKKKVRPKTAYSFSGLRQKRKPRKKKAQRRSGPTMYHREKPPSTSSFFSVTHKQPPGKWDSHLDHVDRAAYYSPSHARNKAQPFKRDSTHVVVASETSMARQDRQNPTPAPNWRGFEKVSFASPISRYSQFSLTTAPFSTQRV